MKKAVTIFALALMLGGLGSVFNDGPSGMMPVFNDGPSGM